MKRLRLLGAVEIEEEDGRVRPFEARRYIVLLALLALRPARTFARSELIAAVWPDSDEAAGRAALRTALSALRRSIGSDCFRTTPQTVTLAAGVFSTDVALLEEVVRKARTAAHAQEAQSLLREMETLNRGPLLPGRYDDWIVAERERIEAMVQSARSRCDALIHAEERHFTRPKQDEPALLRLPLFCSRFLGRDAEIEAVYRMLQAPGVRFVTLTGTAGIGKTRLSVEIARRLASEFSGAVCFVPLETVTEGAEILPAVARALQNEGDITGNPENALGRRLRELGDSLLILDNLEQVVANGAARALRALLALSPEVRLLVTSRQMIGCEGERTFSVAGLPDETNEALFVEQAQAVQAEFALTEKNRPAVERLCRTLEGIPLAIELCAAWASILTPQQMLLRLEDRFALLKSRRPEVAERHRSLHAALEWGCPTEPGLLAFFLALSVFRGGFTLASAEAVTGGDALEPLAILRERSLILSEPQADGDMRYRLLETIREFAAEKLDERTQGEVQRRHLAYFCGQVEMLTAPLSGADAARYFDMLERDDANFRAAIAFGLTDTPESLGRAYTMIHLLSWFWRMRGHSVAQERWFDRLFARLQELPETVQPWVLLDQATRVPAQSAEPLLQEALAGFEALADTRGVAKVLQALSHISFYRGDVPAMDSYAQRAIALHVAGNNMRDMGYVLAELAGKYVQVGRTDEARSLWAQCRGIGRQLGDVGTLAVLDRAEGFQLYVEGRSTESLPFFERALTTFRQKGETWHVMDTLERYGDALAASEEPERSRLLLREAANLALSLGEQDRAAEIRAKLT